MVSTNIADTACQHNRLMITAQFRAVMAVNILFVGTEITQQSRTTKFVVKCRATQRAVSHDLKRSHDAVRLAEVLFPRLFETRNTQVGDREPHQTSLRFGTTSGGTFVTDFAAGAGRSSRPWRDSRRVVVSFHFHQDMRLLLMEVVQAVSGIGIKAPYLRSFHHRSVIFIR